MTSFSELHCVAVVWAQKRHQSCLFFHCSGCIKYKLLIEARPQEPSPVRKEFLDLREYVASQQVSAVRKGSLHVSVTSPGLCLGGVVIHSPPSLADTWYACGHKDKCMCMYTHAHNLRTKGIQSSPSLFCMPPQRRPPALITHVSGHAGA